MAGKIFNTKPQKRVRQRLRNNSTEAEKFLWSKLKRKQFLGYKFRRQHGIGKYIVDFYCPHATLAIELDGVTHYTDEQIAYDKEKEGFIRAKGIQVLRFTNEDVYKRIDIVLEAILVEIEKQEH